MAGSLVVMLTPERVDMAPGDTRDVSLDVRNLSDIIDQYTVEISGLDSDWFTPPMGFGLFPQENQEARLSFHPPRGLVRKGSYPFRVLVRSQGGAAEAAAEGVLQITGGEAKLRAELVPQRQASRGRGTFRVRMSNPGGSDVRVDLTARDAEDGCEFRFEPDESPLVEAGGKPLEVTVRVRPRRRPWVGPEHSYDFTVSARPQGPGPEPQTLPGQFTHRPRLPSWAPVRTALIWLAAIVAIVLIGRLVLSTTLPGQFLTRARVSIALVRGFPCSQQALDGLCAPEVFAVQPQADDECTYDGHFAAYVDADSDFIGPCRSDVAYDGFANGMQLSAKGVLLWQRDSDTVFFFTGGNLYGFIQGKSQLIHRGG